MPLGDEQLPGQMRIEENYENMMCPKCCNPHALLFTFGDGTFECECFAEGPVSDLIPIVELPDDRT